MFRLIDVTTFTQASTTTVDTAGNTATVSFAIDDIDGTIIGSAEHGTVSVNDDNSITYTPDANYTGADDTITLTETTEQWASASSASSQWSSSSYSAAQATGSPNTGLKVGDNQSESGNAWAEASSDRDNEQTLMLNYPEPIVTCSP
jgi:hypothetical protein